MKNSTGFPAGSPLVWTQPKAMRRAYELKNGDEPIGHLRFEKSCGSLATAELGSQSWTFKREGFLNPRVTVRTANSEANLAVFHPNWAGGGLVEFADGRHVRWRSGNFWGSEWSFLGEGDRPLLRFKQHGGLIKISAQLEIAPGSAGAEELSVLAALGWYLMLLTAQDASAVAANVAIIS